MSIEKIKTLLESESPHNLQEARKLTREMLTDITAKMSTLFLERLELMGLIASSKRNSEAILQLDREYELIQKFSQLATEKGESKFMVEMLIWLITAAGKEKQRNILERNSVFIKEDIDTEKLLSNLLELTAIVAPNYAEYGDDFDATKMARNIENDMIKNIAGGVRKKGVCLDLGCADGVISRLISSLGFDRVIGYDVSPDMLQIAKSHEKNGKNIDYEEYNLFKGIPHEDNSVDFIVSNFGSASEVHPHIIAEVGRVLKQGGKAFLSFYNKESIMNDWWQPWQPSIEAVVNTEDDIVEVPIKGNKSFKVYARSMSCSEIESLLPGTGLTLVQTLSHSSMSAMMPPIFFEDTKRTEHVRNFEQYHAHQKPHIGYYLNVVLSK